MNNLSSFLLEKLKINKNTHIYNSNDEIINRICDMCDFDTYNKNGSTYKKYRTVVSNWVAINDVKSIRAITSYDDLKKDGVSEDRIKLFEDDPKETIKIVLSLYNEGDKYKIKFKDSSESKFYANEKYFVMHDYRNGLSYDRVFIKEN